MTMVSVWQSATTCLNICPSSLQSVSLRKPDPDSIRCGFKAKKLLISRLCSSFAGSRIPINLSSNHEEVFRASKNAGKVSALRTEKSEALILEKEEEVDHLMEGISFGQLCDEFECVSSPAVERTARQLAKDILEIKEERRLLTCFSTSVTYKDPLRSFTGRELLKRPSWILNALDKPKVALLSMEMKTTSELSIRWKLSGYFKIPGASSLAGPLSLTVTSVYALNQISGQVVSQSDSWNLSGSSPLAAAYFWASRLAWTAVQSSKDASESIQKIQKKLDEGSDDGEIFADPTDPRKFFQQSNPNSEIYQIAFFVALIYLLVQFLRYTL